jgi:hypothetical protein
MRVNDRFLLSYGGFPLLAVTVLSGDAALVTSHTQFKWFSSDGHSSFNFSDVIRWRVAAWMNQLWPSLQREFP